MSAVNDLFISYFNKERVYGYIFTRRFNEFLINFYNILKTQLLPIVFNIKFEVQLLGQ